MADSSDLLLPEAPNGWNSPNSEKYWQEFQEFQPSRALQIPVDPGILIDV
jgi:hypothetical protein